MVRLPRAPTECEVVLARHSQNREGLNPGRRSDTSAGECPGHPIVMPLTGRCPCERVSELPGEAVCNQEYAGGVEQRLDDEAEPVVAQRQAPVFQDPGIAAF